MRLLNTAIFLLCFLLYLLNELIFKKLNNIFFLGYYNDILAPILLLSYSNFLLSRYNKALVGIKSFIFIVICSFVWEILALLIKENSVADILDCGAYLLGCMIYNLVIFIFTKKSKKNNASPLTKAKK